MNIPSKEICPGLSLRAWLVQTLPFQGSLLRLHAIGLKGLPLTTVLVGNAVEMVAEKVSHLSMII